MLSKPLAIDAMGGDNAPHAVIAGARLALRADPELAFQFHGDEAVIEPILAKMKDLKAVSTVVHTAHAITMDEKPSVALRKGRKSSMRMALDAVSVKEACAMVSAGNTGALMVMAKMVFRTLKGIERPAITAFVPARSREEVVLLDMGANVDCTVDHLLQFAIMGDAYARAMLGLERPKVGLLNVGAEELKGHGIVQGAHKVLKSGNLPIDYYGFVEGNDLLDGTVDVVVTDGFTGNIALKTAEGTARLIYTSIKSAIDSSLQAKIGLWLAKAALKKALKKFDPREHNGAILLGLNGIVVKSHGSADAKSFSNAIHVAAKLVRQDINKKIIEELSSSDMTVAAEAPAAVKEAEAEAVEQPIH